MTWADDLLKARGRQERLGWQGLPPCGRLMHPNCRYGDDVGHAADVIEESRKLEGFRPADEVLVASLVARIHGILTQPVLDDVRAELRRRKGAGPWRSTGDA